MKELFQTKRLYVRSLRKTDLENFQKLLDHPKVKKFTNGKGILLEEGEPDFEKLLTLSRAKNKSFWVWAVILKESSKFIGTCAVIKNDAGEHEIGYRLMEDYWHKGFGQEIANELIEFACEEMEIDNLTAYVDKENVASIRILGKSQLNFRKEVFNKDTKSIDYVYSS